MRADAVVKMLDDMAKDNQSEIWAILSDALVEIEPGSKALTKLTDLIDSYEMELLQAPRESEGLDRDFEEHA